MHRYQRQPTRVLSRQLLGHQSQDLVLFFLRRPQLRPSVARLGLGGLLAVALLGGRDRHPPHSAAGAARPLQAVLPALCASFEGLRADRGHLHGCGRGRRALQGRLLSFKVIVICLHASKIT